MQMKMFLTRLGENSRMIVTGDPEQVDLPRGVQVGLPLVEALLSFPAFPLVPGGQPGPMLGDIILARGTIEREALELDKPVDEHIAHLIVHGFLHLFGYDHIENKMPRKWKRSRLAF
jgi:hypothetical protein